MAADSERDDGDDFSFGSALMATKRNRHEGVKRHIERRFVQHPDKQEHAPEEIKAANQVEGDYISLKQLDRFVSKKINEVK